MKEAVELWRWLLAEIPLFHVYNANNANNANN